MPSSLRFSVLIFSILLCVVTPARAIYKCEAGGHISYRDTPCPESSSSKSISLPVAPSDSASAQQRSLREKKELQAIEAARSKEEAQAQKEYLRKSKEQENKRKHCARLQQTARWAQEDVRHANIKNIDKMKRKAQRATEKHDLECSR
ncbi:hypothetical protein D3C72_86330 [compost metagenome]